MTLPEDREYFNSPSVYRGSTAKPGGSLKNDFWDNPVLTDLIKQLRTKIFQLFTS